MASLVINGDTSGSVTLTAAVNTGVSQITLPVSNTGTLLLDKLSSFTTNGYITFTSGLTLQWGFHPTGVGVGTAEAINLPTTFNTAALSAYVCGSEAATSDRFALKVAAISTTQLTIMNTDSGAYPFYFFAIGY